MTKIFSSLHQKQCVNPRVMESSGLAVPPATTFRIWVSIMVVMHGAVRVRRKIRESSHGALRIMHASHAKLTAEHFPITHDCLALWAAVYSNEVCLAL